jgi:hypothetical protein
LRCRRSNRFNHTAAETPVAFVRNSILTGRNCALRAIEHNSGRAIASGLEKRRLVYLPVTYLYGASKRCVSGANEPMQRAGRERRTAQQRMIVPLHDD